MSDLPLNGTGATDDSVGSFALDLTGPGVTLRYRRDGDGGTSVSGTFRHTNVDLREAA